MDTRKLQIVHEFDFEPTYIVTADDDHEDIATVEAATGWEVADELVKRWNAYPELVAKLQAIARMETASEYEERTEDGMSGDDAIDTLSNLIDDARTLLATLKP